MEGRPTCGQARATEYVQKKGGVWFATMEGIALHVTKSIEQCYKPRIDDLPYYDGRIPGLPPDLRE
jgi:peptidoglycan-N-acetylglucosamine deacetylase